MSVRFLLHRTVEASEAIRCLTHTHQLSLPVNNLPIPYFSDPLCQTRPLWVGKSSVRLPCYYEKFHCNT
ncbi:hypothetical protein SCLCIDRAFT_466976 [Scleroderma citrinum Foug A]|uniref:Uncharacterized protein n=1 Tax=Scleroderma citrinum Foug A TaxID=1036808 RepID=A0A0C3EAP4_9AGAM|nr:hypothetical protein SCLCIDRAFT_466976 [Scleroderma citrinum Foug A]